MDKLEVKTFWTLVAFIGGFIALVIILPSPKADDVKRLTMCRPFHRERCPPPVNQATYCRKPGGRNVHAIRVLDYQFVDGGFWGRTGTWQYVDRNGSWQALDGDWTCNMGGLSQ